MKELTDKQLHDMAYAMGRKILLPLGIIQLLILIALISSPVIWIWHSWGLAWKVGLSALVLAIFINSFYKYLNNALKDDIKERLTSNNVTEPSKKSKFQERLEQLAKERGITIPETK